MKHLQVRFRVVCQFSKFHKLSKEDFEKIKKRSITQLFLEDLMKENLIQIKLDELLPATVENPVDEYKSQLFLQTTEEHNEMINALKHLEAAIMGLTSTNTQETLLRYSDKLKEILK